jgi:bacterioferritin
MVPGSQRLKMIQTTLQPPTDTINVIAVIKGVIDAEDGAIAGYQRIIELADKAKDYVTQDLATTLMGDEQEHRREFVGFLKEYEASL